MHLHQSLTYIRHSLGTLEGLVSFKWLCIPAVCTIIIPIDQMGKMKLWEACSETFSWDRLERVWALKPG